MTQLQHCNIVNTILVQQSLVPTYYDYHGYLALVVRIPLAA